MLWYQLLWLPGSTLAKLDNMNSTYKRKVWCKASYQYLDKRVIKKEHKDLTWFGPNLAYVHGEKTWESFINRPCTKRSNLPLDATRVFTFHLTSPRLQEYYLLSMHLSLAPLFLDFLWSPLFEILCYRNSLRLVW